MNIIWTFFLQLFEIVDVEIEVAFNIIYLMHYNGLMIFLTSFQLSTWYISWPIHF
jgi:hypothetical protein